MVCNNPPRRRAHNQPYRKRNSQLISDLVLRRQSGAASLFQVFSDRVVERKTEEAVEQFPYLQTGPNSAARTADVCHHIPCEPEHHQASLDIEQRWVFYFRWECSRKKEG